MIRALCLAILMAGTASAGSLEGRLVTFTVLTYDDPAQPYLAARGRTVMVGPGVEFGLEPEGLTGGLDVVPVTVEIGPSRIELSYPRGAGAFFAARFNGYVLRFATDCALFDGAAVDAAASTMTLAPDAIQSDGGGLYINVAGLQYGPDARLAIDLAVSDCPMS
ncbi:MAG: hypothetical protein V4712_04375 [Pseudomonadota bacterium]